MASPPSLIMMLSPSHMRELIGARERSLREMFKGQELEEKIKEMRLSAIKDLVDRQLILQEFKKMQEKGASIPDYVIDDRLQAVIREEFGGDRAAFVRTLYSRFYCDSIQGDRTREDYRAGDAPVEGRKQLCHLAHADPNLLRQEQIGVYNPRAGQVAHDRHSGGIVR